MNTRITAGLKTIQTCNHYTIVDYYFFLNVFMYFNGLLLLFCNVLLRLDIREIWNPLSAKKIQPCDETNLFLHNNMKLRLFLKILF